MLKKPEFEKNYDIHNAIQKIIPLKSLDVRFHSYNFIDSCIF